MVLAQARGGGTPAACIPWPAAAAHDPRCHWLHLSIGSLLEVGLASLSRRRMGGVGVGERDGLEEVAAAGEGRAELSQS